MSSHIDPQPEDDAEVLSSRFPTAYTILFALIVLVAILTWIIPAGQYERIDDETVGGVSKLVEILWRRPPSGMIGA